MTNETSTPTDTPPIRGYKRIPIVGNRVNTLRFFSDPIGHMLRLEREFGSIAAFTAGDPSFVCAFGAENNRTILSEPGIFNHFLNLPFSVPEGSSATRIFNGILSMNGERHKRCRRLLLPVVSKAAVSSYSPAIVRITEQFVDQWPSTKPEDIMREMQELTIRVLSYCLFGVEPTRDPGSLGYLGLRMLGFLSSPLTILFPVNIRGTPYARFLDMCEQIEAQLRRFIRERLAEDTTRQDVLSTLMRSRDEDDRGITDDELVGLTISMLFGGQDPIASTLSWTLVLLSQHPEILADVQSELDDVLRGAPPTEADLTRLPLLDAIINESMRIFPAIVHLIFRRTTETTRLGPHQLPAGSVIALSPLVTHRDPDIFPDPLRFRPKRWESVKAGPYEYMPYGAGPRMCIGPAFSAHVLRIQLATILRRFHPVLPPGIRIDHLVRAANLGTKAPVPLHLASRRDSPPKPTGVRGNIHDLVKLPMIA